MRPDLSLRRRRRRLSQMRTRTLKWTLVKMNRLKIVAGRDRKATGKGGK